MPCFCPILPLFPRCWREGVDGPGRVDRRSSSRLLLGCWGLVPSLLPVSFRHDTLVAMAKKKRKTDWRALPRKPEGAHRSSKLTLRVTEAEHDRLRELAEAAGQSLSDYVISRALRKRQR